MTGSAAGDGPLRSAAVEYLRTSVGFFAVVLVLRLAERWMAGAAHALPSASAADWLRAIGSDAALTLWVAVVLAPPVLVLARWRPRAARLAHRAALVVVALVAAALSQYFAVTLVPLGADLFGYSWLDIRETVTASGGVSIGAVLGLALVGAAAWIVPNLGRRVPVNRITSALIGAAMLASVGIPSLLRPSPSAFTSDTAYWLALNKSGWFAAKALALLVEKLRPPSAGLALQGYPLRHRVSYDDVLGPRMTLGDTPPNLVFVIIEGLGRDFTGRGAELGGFTPFLDSLADRSLSWDNFLSTSGRTFGILPSLLGSLPFGANGFMELGSRMPSHLTLGPLLKSLGYTTNYFTGTNGHFDNIDAFMERQRVDRFTDASGFSAADERLPAGAGGESWGYSDGALYQRSLELIDAPSRAPRLDIYLTISTHEPFIPPRAVEYRARFERRLAAMQVSAAKRAVYREYSGVFASLLYADDALRGFLQAYAARADYGRTIFFITGDHRLIPVPPSNRIARYHVPLLVFSPMLLAPQHIGAVSSHLDVVPSVLALLQHRYSLAPPDSAAWLGTGLDTVVAFRHAHALALMRTKNALDDYLDGTRFLGDEQLFRLGDGMVLSPLRDASMRDDVRTKLNRFRAINRFVTTGDHLMPRSSAGPGSVDVDPTELARESTAYEALDLDRATPVEAFTAARGLAEQKQYETARLVLRRLLRDAPSYHDARALFGRTYAWERRFDEARPILTDLVRRAPNYADGIAALIELDLFQERGAPALIAATSALARFPADPGLLYCKARALELTGQKAAALATLNALRRVQPRSPAADSLRMRLVQP
ncbi:MAG: sulfatase-like hydrolase/transferase [Gemmatimonadetes bacterium]|nr:sulfatase-like hydrolase/transferase [Gemmatimonadota bacterium]